MKLTKADKLILNSYSAMLHGLAEYLGTGFEFVLHSLENYESSAITVINGYHSNRSVGAPITTLALDMLKQIEESNDARHRYVSYFNKTGNGTVTKSATIPITGENDRIIGLLCMNFYMDTPLSKIIETFTDTNNKSEREVFVENTTELIDNIFDAAWEEVFHNSEIPSVNRNKEVLAILQSKGVFNIKDSVPYVAKRLGISRNTVYLHLRNAAGNKG